MNAEHPTVFGDEVFLSIVMPAYNEEGIIESSLRKVKAFLDKQPYKAEIIVVDDGSTDDTLNIVKNWVRSRKDTVRVKIIKNSRNMGKGYSVRSGVLNSLGKVVLFTDVDLSAPIEQLPKLINPILSRTSDITFGSRALKESVIPVHQPWLRTMAGRLFNIFVKLVSGLPFQDTQCGFKAFSRQAAVEVFNKQTVYGFGFDPEILYIAQKYGLRLQEVPVIWSNSQDSKVRFLSDSTEMLLDLFRTRLNDWRGRYKRQGS